MEEEGGGIGLSNLFIISTIILKDSGRHSVSHQSGSMLSSVEGD